MSSRVLGAGYKRVCLFLGLVALGFFGLSLQLHYTLHGSHSLLAAPTLAVAPLANLAPSILQSCFHEQSPLPAAAISIIAASCNRSSALSLAYPSWLGVRGVAELVIVDWASQPPVRAYAHAPASSDPVGPMMRHPLMPMRTIRMTLLPPNLTTVLLRYLSSSQLRLPAADPRARLFRVAEGEGATEWNLARAYNLAAAAARGEFILKVDSDTYCSPAVLTSQPLAERSFLRGCRDQAPDENSRHLNGVLLVRRAGTREGRSCSNYLQQCSAKFALV